MFNTTKLLYKKISEYNKEGEKIIGENDYDKIFFISNELKKLGFETKITELNRPILKISNDSKTIYRRFKQGTTYNLSNGEVGILDRDKNYLNLTNEGIKINIKIASRLDVFLFYYNNPNLDIRFATRMFCLTIPISFIIGVLTGLLSNFIYNHI